MKQFVASLILIFSCCVAVAQKAPIKFGDVPPEALAMKVYAKDSSAAAVILADFGESSITFNQNAGFALSFERTTRIKILTKDGTDWGNFSIPLYHSGSDAEKLSGLKASSYNLENGKVVETKVKNDNIFKEKYDANFDITKVSIPNVKEGSVVEITYKITSDFLSHFQDWEFQYTIPVVWSEYRARIPEYFHYDKYMQGYVPLAISEHTTASSALIITSRQDTGNKYVASSTVQNNKVDYIEHRYRWAAKDVPAFKAEPFITTSKDYISKINFEISHVKFPNQPVKNYLGTWEDINKAYMESENFGGEVTGNGFLKKVVSEVTAGKATAEEQINSIYSFVKNTIEWDGHTRKSASGSLKKVLEEKKGNSAEINLLLASMLHKAGFSVSPVLISTRDHGFVRETVPVSSQFNHVICLLQLQDGELLLDATDRYLPLGLLPERCLNGQGFVVSKAGYKWVNLAAPSKSRTVITGSFTLSPQGELAGNLNFSRYGYEGKIARKQYFTKGEADYVKGLNQKQSWDVVKSEFQHAEELHEPFKESHELQINDHVTVAGSVIYLNPFLHSQLEQNPFKLEQRVYPVDFNYPFDMIYTLSLTIPEGYGVDELPKSKFITLPGNTSRYTYSAAINGNTLVVTSNLQVNKSLFSQDEYVNLREFYNQVVAKQAEQIVIKKK